MLTTEGSVWPLAGGRIPKSLDAQLLDTVMIDTTG